jgi:hypothetical protein
VEEMVVRLVWGGLVEMDHLEPVVMPEVLAVQVVTDLREGQSMWVVLLVKETETFKNLVLREALLR